MQLVAKIARCRIADDVFQSGDDILLPNISISLGEDQRSSTCNFSLNDPGLLIGARYREISVKQGGIQVPTELLAAPQQQQQAIAPASTFSVPGVASPGSSVPSSSITLPTGTGGAILSRPTRVSFAAQQSYYNQVWNTMTIVPDRQKLIQEAAAEAIRNRARYEAVTAKTGVPWYIIAVIHYREASYNFKTHLHNGNPLSAKTYEVPAGRPPGNPPFTWEYSAIDALTYDGLKKNRDWSPAMTMWVLERYNGTGYLQKGRPSPYLLAGCQHYQGGLYVGDNRYSASAIDRRTGVMPLILAILKGSSTPSPPPTPSSKPMTATPAVAAPAVATPAVTTPTITQIPPPQESSVKGTEIIIELVVGYGATWKDAIAFHFIHTETKTEWGADGRQITTFTGKSIRWLLTRVPVTQSFENINLKQFTEMQLSGFNLKLEMEGKGLTYQHLSQDGQVPLDVLFREAKRMGFRVAEGVGKKSDTLLVEPLARPEFTNVIIDEEILIKPAIFTDKARANQSGAPAATVSDPMTGTGEAKTAIDRTSGNMTQAKPESKTGTGQAQTSGGITGATAAPVAGTVKPDPMSSSTTATKPDPMSGDNKGVKPAAAPTETPKSSSSSNTAKVEGPIKITKPDGTVVSTTVTTDQKIEPGKIARTKTTVSIVTRPGGLPQTTTKKVVTEVTDGKTKTTTTLTEPGKQPQTTTEEENKVSAEDRKLLEQSKVSSGTSTTTDTGAAAPANVDPVTGLPNQQPGFIDLRDGRAEAEVIADESRRVKGYEDSFVLVMNLDTLQLVPGQIVALSKRLFPDAFATEKRIAQVDHNFEAGTTTINTYTPQAQLPAGSSGGGGSAVIAAPVPAAGAAPAPTQFATPSAPPGKFIFPIPKGATTIGDGYGPRASRSPSYRHTILDVTAPQGTVCVAMADGVVSIQPNNGGAGNMMTIRHGGGYESIYMHGMPGCYIVSSGPVKQGQPIFKVGTTGGSSGPHLHLKFTLNGTYCLLSKVGIYVLKMGLPVHRYNAGCTAY